VNRVGNGVLENEKPESEQAGNQSKTICLRISLAVTITQGRAPLRRPRPTRNGRFSREL